uniref:Uncharacterized protein n=1 Tax=Ditylenchus dipsaci TaxID=166011 RepID=A0A915DIC1_9BILA
MKSPQVQPCVMVSQLSEGIANLSLPVSSPEPVYSPQQQVQRPVSPKKTKENEDETPKTPSPDMTLKSVLKRHRPIEPSKEALRAVCGQDLFSVPPIYNTTVESAMDQTMALEMETVRLNNTNLGANISKLSRGSLCHGESLLEDETFSEKVSNKQQPSAQIPNFADSSLWDAGGGCDYDDDEEEHQERQEQASGFFSRTKEWPSVVDNSLGLENSHLMSEDSPSAVSNRTVVRQISKESRMSSPLSTSMAVFDSTSDNCFASPAVKHIVLRANKNKPSPALVLPKPKILHNNMDSPSVVELGLRRSNRNRLPRLNQALGQHPIYERDAEGNETLVGANDVVIKDKLLKKHKVADPLVAEERDRELKNRRRLQHDKKDELRKRRFH